MSLRESAKVRTALLRQEVRRSPIHDLREMSLTNGRLFPTDREPIPWDTAPIVPLMDGVVDLFGNKRDVNGMFKEYNVSVLALNLSTMGASHIQPYKECIPENIPLIDIHIIVGRLKSLFLSRLCRMQLLKTTQETLKDKTFCLSLPKPGLFGNMGAWNRYGAYIYLIDDVGRARWRASGPPDEGDLENFERAIEHLQK